jgi:hypothetical protein
MLSPRQNRLATLSLLLVYVTASTFSGLLHSHSHDCAVDRHNHSECCRSGPHDHGFEEGVCLAHCEPAHQPLHDDDCAVCRFLGHRTTPAEVVEIDGLHHLSVQLPVVSTQAPSESTPRSFHARAPPLVG